jgi:hypothetical protein
MLWVTEAKDGRRLMFETACEVERAEVSDAQALAALCAELRADFAADGVVRYAVAFPARATPCCGRPPCTSTSSVERTRLSRLRRMMLMRICVRSAPSCMSAVLPGSPRSGRLR